MTGMLMRSIMVFLIMGISFQNIEALAEQECTVPERFYSHEPLLKKTPKTLAGGRPAVIVVLGGASSLGGAAGRLELAWPARFGVTLAERFPSARVKIVNLAVARQTAKRAVERLDREVLPLKPTLVVWETGTMEAVRGLDVDEFRETVQFGIDKIRDSGAELVLMNMQFSRNTEAVIHFEPYLNALRELADVNDVPRFRRYGLMRYWAESGALDLRAEDGEKRRQVAARLYACLGRAMADFVMRGGPLVKSATGRELER